MGHSASMVPGLCLELGHRGAQLPGAPLHRAGREIAQRQSLSCIIKGSQTSPAQSEPQTSLPAQQ